MNIEEMLEFLIYRGIANDMYVDKEFREILDKKYNLDAFYNAYEQLGKKFLQIYALSNTEKSD